MDTWPQRAAGISCGRSPDDICLGHTGHPAAIRLDSLDSGRCIPRCSSCCRAGIRCEKTVHGVLACCSRLEAGAGPPCERHCGIRLPCRRNAHSLAARPGVRNSGQLLPDFRQRFSPEWCQIRFGHSQRFLVDHVLDDQRRFLTLLLSRSLARNGCRTRPIHGSTANRRR